MTKTILGAIDIQTKKYVLPSMASKNTQYECVECKKRVILRQGNIRVHHFAHSSQTNICTYYEHPNEAQIHKDAKLLIQKLLIEKRLLCFSWECSNCSGFWGLEEIPSIKYKEGDEALLEYRDKNGKWIADVALVNNGEVRYIFEIKNKHATITERPEPWFEIDATTLHQNIDEQMQEYKRDILESPDFNYIFNIPCIRKNTLRKCYGSFCYKESWVRRIPEHNPKNTDNSCILCKRTEEYIPTFDGCTSKFQGSGYIRLCQDCLLIDTYHKKIRELYADDLVRNKKIEWSKQGKVEIGVGKEDVYSKQEQLILNNVPKLWNRFGQERMWNQETPCIVCGRNKYNPIFFNKRFHALCKICLGNEESQKNILQKINSNQLNKEEKCLIMDD
jgi:hypothetical protein